MNRARLASLTTFLHHDDDRRIVCVYSNQVARSLTMASKGWWDRERRKDRSLVGIRISMYSTLPCTRPSICDLPRFCVLGRTCVIALPWPPHAASAMIYLHLHIAWERYRNGSITVVTGYFSTDSRHPRRTACLNSIDYQGLKSRSQGVLKVAGT